MNNKQQASYLTPILSLALVQTPESCHLRGTSGGLVNAIASSRARSLSEIATTHAVRQTKRTTQPARTELDILNSEHLLKRISKTGHLLLVWNHTKPDKISSSLSRIRLAVAIESIVPLKRYLTLHIACLEHVPFGVTANSAESCEEADVSGASSDTHSYRFLQRE